MKYFIFILLIFNLKQKNEYSIYLQDCNVCELNLTNFNIRSFELGTNIDSLKNTTDIDMNVKNSFNKDHIIYSFSEEVEVLDKKKSVIYYLEFKSNKLVYYSFEIDIEMDRSYFFDFLTEVEKQSGNCNSFINSKKYINIQKNSICTKFINIKNFNQKKYIFGGIGYN